MEKTDWIAASSRLGRKHLHGRGEDSNSSASCTQYAETPPRTWRRINPSISILPPPGNTSTDMEKTTDEPPIILDAWETPPRTWRRPGQVFVMRDSTRNTSTDVEKTIRIPIRLLVYWKHLHGRGEDSWRSATSVAVMETPPRTWRRLLNGARNHTRQGNTSTDVEKT